MNSKKVLPCGALIIGILISVTGITFVVMYVSEAVISRQGEADQSLLFWYLPILFIGLFGIILGTGIGILGYIGLRKHHREDSILKIDK